MSSMVAGRTVKFTADAKGEAGFGPRANYAGSLVPFSAGIGYEDNPTISYTPVDGQAFLREWLAPVMLETLALVLQAAARQDAFILLLGFCRNFYLRRFAVSSSSLSNRAL